MSLAEQRGKLLKYGYYRPDGIDVEDVDAWRSLGVDHVYHGNAARRYQEFFLQAIGPQVYAVHGREFILSDDIGPVTAWELSKPRCGVPDLLPLGAEKANWPNECRMKLTASYKPGTTLPGITTAEYERATLRALLNVMEDFEIKIELDPESYPNTSVNRKPARLGGSILADQYLATNRCDFTSSGRIDSDRNWEFWYLVTVMSHEDGHAWGMPHNSDPDALLYPSINRAAVARRGKMNATDKQTMRNLGYVPRTTPIPPLPPGGVILGELTIDDSTLAITRIGEWPNGSYIFTGSPK